jgi:hypothetical protein
MQYQVNQHAFSAWSVVRKPLLPLMLLLTLVNLMASALQHSELNIVFSVVGNVVPVVAGYEARRRGGSYGDTLRTSWLALMAGVYLVVLPLGVVGVLAGVTHTQLPSAVQPDTTAYAVVAAVVAIILPVLLSIGWIIWIPFTLVGAWIAGGPDTSTPSVLSRWTMP